MDGLDAGVEALLLGRLESATEVPMRRHSSQKAASCGICLGGGLGQRMVGRDRHERGAEQRVGPRRVDLQLVMALGRGLGVERPADHQAFRPADPVGLHQAHLLRPLVERVQRLQQLVGIVR